MSASRSLANSRKKRSARTVADKARGGFLLTNLTKAKIPPFSWRAMKDRALGSDYDLSLVFAGTSLSRKLNIKHRGKSYVPNVLSFPLAANAGEIVVCPAVARKEHAARGESYEYFLALLVIHGCLHLKGLRHGSTMESQEKKLLRSFNIENSRER